MIPDLFSIGPIAIHSFGLMVAAAIIVGLRLAVKSFQKFGLPVTAAEPIVFVAGISGVVGARIWSMLFFDLNSTIADPVGTLLSSGGFVFHGGLIVSLICTAIYIRRKGLPLGTVADALGPALTLGYGVGRLGCQLSGDGDYGAPTESIWGMSYSTGYIPTPPGVLVYPTPFFESIGALISVWLLIKLESLPAWQSPGKRFGAMLVLMGFFRFMVEFIRVEPMLSIGITEAQLVSILIAIFGCLLIFHKGHAHAA